MVSNSIKSVVGFGIVAAIAYKLYNTKKFTTSAKFSFDKLDFNFKKKKILLTISILNPTNARLTVNSLVGELLVNNKAVALVEDFTKREILPNTRNSITLTVSPSIANSLSVLLSFIKSKINKIKTPQLAVFNGNANVNGGILPINIKLN